MRIILHVGRPKTGSTAIQRWLSANHEPLAHHGVALSKVSGSPNNISLAAQFGVAPVGWLRRHSVTSQRDARALMTAEGYTDALAAEIEANALWATTLVLTSEQLAGIRKPREIRTFLARFTSDLHVVAYFREQVDLIPSAWHTNVRGGSTKSLGAFAQAAVQTNRFDYERWARGWEEAFQMRFCTFRDYHQASGNDIRRDFATEVLELTDLTDFSFTRKRENASWVRGQIEAVRLVNRLAPFWRLGDQAPNPANLALRKKALRATRGLGGRARLSHGQRVAVATHFADSNLRFSNRYLGHPYFGMDLE